MKHSVFIGTAVALTLFTQLSFADTAAAPAPSEEAEQAAATVYGKLRLQYESRSTPLDDRLSVGRASVGVKGPLKYGDIKVLYDIEAEFADVANADTASDNREVRLRTAQVTVPTKYGVLAGGRGASGQRGDLYGHLDIFENTEVHNPASGNTTQSNDLTTQTIYVPQFLLFKTEKYKNLYMVPGIVSMSDSNGKSVDAKSIRFMYDNGKLKTGVGTTVFDKTALGTTKDYTRNAASIAYKADKWQAGVTLEDNKNHPTGDFEVVGVGATLKVSSKVATNLAYLKKDHKTNNALDNAAVIGNVTYALGNSPKQGKSAKLFLEHEAHDLDKNDKTTVGISLGF